jgi:hypothetical protein
MKDVRIAIVVCAIALIPLPLPAHDWYVHGIDGGASDWGASLVQAPDGGYYTCGTSTMGIAQDFLISKFDTAGIHEWSRTLGGSGNDQGYCITMTSDGGLAVTGRGNSWGSASDFFLSKLTADGDTLWSRNFDAPGGDWGHSVVETQDMGFVICGKTASYGAGHDDVFLLKTDSAGTFLWARTYGEYGYDQGQTIIELPDGSLVFTGMTNSFPGSRNLLITKLDADGNHLWSRILKGNNIDEGYSVIRCSDGGFAIVGHTMSIGSGEYDVSLSRLDADGNHLWSRVLGGTQRDQGYSVCETGDGGLVVWGRTKSFGVGYFDYFLTKFDAAGNHLWFRTLGSENDEAPSQDGAVVIETPDGRLIAVGESRFIIAHFSELLLVQFDSLGNTCIGDTASPTVLVWEPEVDSVEFTVESQTPTPQVVSPTLQVQSPEMVIMCPLCGDANNDQFVTSADGYTILNSFGTGDLPWYCWAVNVNGDGNFTTADGYHLLNYFGAGPVIDCQPCEY